MSLTVLSDSSYAVKYAIAQKLIPSDVKIRTSSPYLAKSKNFCVEELEKDISFEEIIALIHSSRDLYTRIYLALMDSNFADWALLGAVETATNFSKIVYKAKTLKEEDFSQPIVFLKVHSKALYNAPWDKILANNKNLQVIDIPFEKINCFPSTKTKLNIWEEWKIIEPRVYFLKFLYLIGNTFTNKKQKTILLLEYGNEFLREIAVYLGLKGFHIQNLKKGNIVIEPLDKKFENQLRELLTPIFESYLQQHVSLSAIQPVIDAFFSQFTRSIQVFNASLKMWRKQLQNIHAKALLTNFPVKAMLLPLRQVCTEKNMLLVGAQHGNAREINGFHQPGALSIYENNVVDIFFTHNEEASKVSQQSNPFNVGKCISIGVPSSCLKKKKDFGNKKVPILYVSNLLYMGNVNPLYVGAPDHYRATFEVNIIEKVLQKIPYKVFFKPRPHHNPRYLDPCLIIECVQKMPNIVLYEGNLDLSHLMQKHKVIILTGCSNTLGKCLLTNKPLIFINIPWISPIKPELQQSFSQSVFFFDITSPTVYEDLKNLLHKPLLEIENLWENRYAYRKNFIERYIAKNGLGAGKRGAQILQSILAKNEKGIYKS